MPRNTIPKPELFTCRVPLEVRWRDVDAMGHVNNGKSFEFEYLVTAQADGRVVATGSTVQACYDYAEAKTMKIPAEFRDAILRYEKTTPVGAG